ncbi:MAG: hypothetical protein Q9182_003162 [Xanthomendoza sp. 2 TL-2023]
MLPSDALTPQTRLLLAVLSTLQQSQCQSPSPTSPPPPYRSTTAPATVPEVSPTTLPTDPPVADDDDDDNDEETYPASPPLHIHISSRTTITGSHNRLVLPSPTHLSSLVSLAVKRALQSEDGEVNEGEQQMAITVDAGTKIEGNGNVVGYYHPGKACYEGGNSGSRSGTAGSIVRTGIWGERKRRANSEPVDELRVRKRVEN